MIENELSQFEYNREERKEIEKLKGGFYANISIWTFQKYAEEYMDDAS